MCNLALLSFLKGIRRNFNPGSDHAAGLVYHAKGVKQSSIFKALAEETRTEPKYVTSSGCFQPNEEWKDEANLRQRL